MRRRVGLGFETVHYTDARMKHERCHPTTPASAATSAAASTTPTETFHSAETTIEAESEWQKQSAAPLWLHY